MTYVIQITGGRDYTDGSAIYNLMKQYVDKYGANNIIVRHGKARGADSLAHFQARRLGVPEDHIQARPPEYYGFSWKEGLDAGNKRNIAMLEEEPIPNVVLAFPADNSVGTVNMMEFAMERNIELVVQGRAPEVINAADIKSIGTPVNILADKINAAVATNTMITDKIEANSIVTDIEFGIQQELSAAMLFVDGVWTGASVSRLPEYSDLDYAVTWRGNLIAFLEIKARRVNVDTYTSTMIPLRKHHIAKQISDNLKIPTYAVIVFQDAMVSFHLENEPDEVQFVKRDDRDKGMQHCFYSHSRFTYHMRKTLTES